MNQRILIGLVVVLVLAIVALSIVIAKPKDRFENGTTITKANKVGRVAERPPKGGRVAERPPKGGRVAERPPKGGSAVAEYKDNVYIIGGHGYKLKADSITFNGSIRPLKVGDIILGEEAPGFMRRITKINGRTLATSKVSVNDVLHNVSISRHVKTHEMLQAHKLHPKRIAEFFELHTPPNTNGGSSVQEPESYEHGNGDAVMEDFEDTPAELEEDYEDSAEDYHDADSVEYYQEFFGPIVNEPEFFDNLDETLSEYFELGSVEGYEGSWWDSLKSTATDIAGVATNAASSVGSYAASEAARLGNVAYQAGSSAINTGVDVASAAAREAQYQADQARQVALALAEKAKQVAMAAARLQLAAVRAVADHSLKAAALLTEAVKQVGRLTINLHRAVGIAMMKGVNMAISGVSRGLKYVGKMAKKLLTLLRLNLHKTFALGTLKMNLSHKFKLDNEKQNAVVSKAITTTTKITHEASITVKGEVNLSPSVKLDFDVVNGLPVKFGVEISSGFGASLTVTAAVESKISKEFSELLYSSPGLIIPIVPGIFMTLGPSLNGVFGVEFSAASSLSLTAGIQTKNPVIAGVMWQYGQGLGETPRMGHQVKFHSQAPTFDKFFRAGIADDRYVNLTGTVTVGLQLQANLLLEGAIGLFLGIKPYIAEAVSVGLLDCAHGGTLIPRTSICGIVSHKKSLGATVKFGGSFFGKDIGSIDIFNVAYDMSRTSDNPSEIERTITAKTESGAFGVGYESAK